MQRTWADKIEAKGLKKGLDKGAAEVRRLVLRHLDQRFGSVPASLQKRLTAIRSVEELGAIADRIFEIQSIEELGLGR